MVFVVAIVVVVVLLLTGGRVGVNVDVDDAVIIIGDVSNKWEADGNLGGEWISGEGVLFAIIELDDDFF